MKCSSLPAPRRTWNPDFGTDAISATTTSRSAAGLHRQRALAGPLFKGAKILLADTFRRLHSKEPMTIVGVVATFGSTVRDAPRSRSSTCPTAALLQRRDSRRRRARGRRSRGARHRGCAQGSRTLARASVARDDHGSSPVRTRRDGRSSAPGSSASSPRSRWCSRWQASTAWMAYVVGHEQERSSAMALGAPDAACCGLCSARSGLTLTGIGLALGGRRPHLGTLLASCSSKSARTTPPPMSGYRRARPALARGDLRASPAARPGSIRSPSCGQE